MLFRSALMANLFINLEPIAHYCQSVLFVSYLMNKSTKPIMYKKDIFGVLCSSGFHPHR